LPIRVAIDGLGGVSRHILAAIAAGGFADLFDVVHVNEPAGAAAALRRLQADSIYGKFPATVTASGDGLSIGGRHIALTSKGPGELDWEASGVDAVVVNETDCEQARMHLERNAKKVVVAGGAAGIGKLVVFGVNEGSYDPDTHHVIATGSARLNAVALVANVIQKRFAIARGSFAVVHPPAATQTAVDSVGADFVGSRSLFTIVPGLEDETSNELGVLDPILGSKLAGSVVYVPAAPVAWMNVAVETERRFERENVVDAFVEAAESEQYGGLLGMVTGPHASRDLLGDARSVVIMQDELEMIGRAFVSVRGWFDADWALACRTADLIAFVCEAGIPGTA